MRFNVIYLIVFISMLYSGTAVTDDGMPRNLNVLIITGGHKFESSFYEIFESDDYVRCDTISQPRANRFLTSPEIEKYDVLVFYDMWQEISAEEKQGLLNLLRQGKGMVFLHHSLVSYQHWDEFKNIIGGRYREAKYLDSSSLRPSTYTHDIYLQIEIADRNHPVTRGLENFTIFDEGYQHIEILPEVHPLLATSHPDCARFVAWAHAYKNSNIVYILLGHGPEAHSDSNYRKLVNHAIRWVAPQENPAEK